MRPTSEITDPSWKDVLDRDREIERLMAEVQRLRAVLRWIADGSPDPVPPNAYQAAARRALEVKD